MNAINPLPRPEKPQLLGNLFGGPCAGKPSLAATLFGRLKREHVDGRARHPGLLSCAYQANPGIEAAAFEAQFGYLSLNIFVGRSARLSHYGRPPRRTRPTRSMPRSWSS